MRTLALVTLAATLSSTARAEDEEDSGDEDSGDEDSGDWGEEGDDAGFEKAEAAKPPPPPEAPGPVSFGGTLQTEEAFWLEPRDGSAFAKARQSTDLWLGLKLGAFRAKVSGHGEYDFAMLANRDEWTQATLDEYLYQVALREAWVSATTGPVDTTLGRQVVSWGEGRTLSVVDVVNPRDLREPGMADLEDLRLPVTMARVTVGLQSDSFWKGSHRFEAMVVPEAFFGYRSPPTGPFGSLPGVIATQGLDYDINGIDDFEGLIAGADVSYNHLQERFDLSQIQGFASWSWRGRGVDLGLLGGSLLDQQGVLVLPDLIEMVTAANLGESVSVDLDHLRYTLVGHTGVAQTPWFLVRWEVAYKHDLPLNVGTVIDTSQGFTPVFDVRTEQTDLLQALVGLSWSGWKGTTVDLDVIDGFFLDEPEDVIFPLDASAYALRLNKPLLKQRMDVEAVVTGWGWTLEHGWLGRAAVSYELMDGVSASVMAITYQPGEERGPILGLESHDRAQVGLRWDF